MIKRRNVACLALIPLLCCALHLSKIEELHAHYDEIFSVSHNRNAASHKWSTFILDNAGDMTPAEIETLFQGFCPVSGSPVHPGSYNKYEVVLAGMAGGAMTGTTHHCCWPCLCDLHDYARVDDKTIMTASGEQTYSFLVIGDPCVDASKLEQPFKQAKGWGPPTTIHESAGDVTCGADGKLDKATYSDNGGVIIGMLHGAADAVDSKVQQTFNAWISTGLVDTDTQDASLRGALTQTEGMFAGKCAQRAAAGFNSGMGDIFREVAKINLLPMQSGGKAIDCKASLESLHESIKGAPLKGSRLKEAFACQGLDLSAEL